MPPKKNGYKMPDPLPAGEILQDLYKKQWRLGPSIGKGGFGEIYSAQEAGSKGASYPYVIKIEPHANGPLFVEMHFYSRVAKQSDIDAFKSSRKMSHLGMPALLGSGSHTHKGEKYRFVVMEKFGSDVWKLYLSNNKKFPAGTVFKLGLQMLDALEYIHSKGYVHADLKGANILLSLKNANQAYLVDFGLAAKFNHEKEFKPNPKKMHDGTIEYLSRDAHQGVQTRRGDLEILAFNLIHWLGCMLPWEKNLSDPKAVQASKEKSMSDIPAFIKACFANSTPPEAIINLLNYINNLKFNEEPDYKKLHKFLQDGLNKTGDKSSTLQFKVNKRQSVGGLSSPESSHKRARSQESDAPKKRGRKAAVNKLDDKEVEDKKAAGRGKKNEESEDVRPKRAARGGKKNYSFDELDDTSDDEDVKPKKAARKVKPKPVIRRGKKNDSRDEIEADTNEDEEDVKPKKAVRKVKPKAAVRRGKKNEIEADTNDDEEDISDEEEVKLKKAAKRGNKNEIDLDTNKDKEDISDEEEVNSKKAARKVKPKAPGRRGKKNEIEADTNDEDISDEEEVKPKKAARNMKPKAAVRRGKKNEIEADANEDEDDISDEEEVQAKKPMAKVTRRGKKNDSRDEIEADTDEGMSDDEEVKARKVKPKQAVKRGKINEIEADTDEDEKVQLKTSRNVKKNHEIEAKNSKRNEDEDELENDIIEDTDEDENRSAIKRIRCEVEDTNKVTEINHNVTVKRGKQNYVPNGFDDISDIDEDEEEVDSIKTVKGKKGRTVQKGRRLKLQRSTSDDELEAQPAVPKKRDRRLNTDSTVKYTAEMLRIMNMKAQRGGGKLNSIKD